MAKILVVDDSALMRKKLREILEPHGHEVVIARDGADALEKARDCNPDLITLDINMPKLDGLSALAALLAENSNHKVIMFSSLTQQGAQATMEALALGAFDFLPKPGGTISLSLDEVEAALMELVDAALEYKVTRRKVGQGILARARRNRGLGGGSSAQPAVAATSALVTERRRAPSTQKASAESGDAVSSLNTRLSRSPFDLTLIGVSTGGPKCIEGLLRQIPAHYPNPILIAQHMPGGFTKAFADRLDAVCALRVIEVSSPEPIQPGYVYIARGGADMAVVNRGGRLIAQSRPPQEEYLWHPSVSVMVQSAMRSLPAKQITGVMLTGMGYDGAVEMTELRKAGGYTIAESSNTSVVFGMPKELIERGGACEVLDNDLIPARLVELSSTIRREHGFG